MELWLYKNNKGITEKSLAFLYKSCKSVRDAHKSKIEHLRHRYFAVEQKISSGDGDDDAEDNFKIQDALRMEGYELQRQIDYFDDVAYAGLLRLQSISSQKAAGFKRYVVDKIMREIYRLKEALPALSKRKEIETKLSESQFLVVKGETGSGKSTQLPQYALEYLKEMKLLDKKIVCTQPRKVSTTSLAERVAFEWGAGNNKDPSLAKAHAVGQTVGYRVGSMRKLSANTRIEYCTEGSFLKSLLSIFEGDQAKDPLKDVGVVIIDEAHERSISCDIILGILQVLAPQRWQDIKVIVTSATLNTELFCKYFYDCPIVEIPGRMYPVDIVYQPIAGANFGVDSDPTSYIQACANIAFDLHVNLRPADGDILCFLTGQDEVEKARDLLEKKLKFAKNVEYEAGVLVLYGKQTPDEQKMVFESMINKRKIVFSTDVAETGVTIDGIRHVIDTGLSKESRYDAKRNVTVLEVDSICKSSATQRKGRAGRTAPGTCYRLYKEDDFEAMSSTQTAEVLCRPLALTLLNLISTGIRQPSEFNWMEPPSTIAVEAALNELTWLSCVTKDDLTKDYYLTEFGKVVVNLQIDPSMAKLIYSAALEGKGRQGCLLAGILSVASNFYWRGGSADSKQAADVKHMEFASEKGDLVGMFKAFTEWRNVIVQSSQVQYSSTASEASMTIADISLDGIESEFDVNTSIASSSDDDDQSLPKPLTNLNLANHRVNTMFQENRNDVPNFELQDDTDGASTITDDVLDISVSDFNDTSVINEISEIPEPDETSAFNDEIARMEEEERQIRKFAGSKASRKWCSDNCINSKSLQVALATANELILELNRLPESSFWKSKIQYGELSDEDIARCFFQAYFMNVAAQIRMNRIYSVLRQENGTSYIHPGSSIAKIYYDRVKKGKSDTMMPSYVVFHSLLSTSRSFMICVVPFSLEWLHLIPPDFASLVDAKLAVIPTDLIQIDRVSVSLGMKFIGKGGVLKKAFESKYKCSIQYDEQQFSLDVWCNGARKDEIQRALLSQLDELRKISLLDKEEDVISGNVRGIFKAGYELQSLLFNKEVMSLHINGIPSDKDITSIKYFIEDMATKCNEGVRIELDHVEILHSDEQEGINALVFIKDPAHAEVIKSALDNDIWDASTIHVSFGGIRPTIQPSSSLAQLVMTWPMSSSAGEARVEFSSAQAANVLLSNIQAFVGTFRAILGDCLIFPLGKRASPLGILQHQQPANPSSDKRPVVVNKLFIVGGENRDVNSYRVRFTQLLSHVDEDTIKECIVGFFSRIDMKDRSLFPTNVWVKRQEVDQNDTSSLNVQLSVLNEFIPFPNALSGPALSFFDARQPGRAGFYLRYNSIEDTQAAYQEWVMNADRKDAQFNGQPIRILPQYTTVLSIHESLWKEIAAPFTEMAKRFLENYPSLTIIEKETKQGNVKVPRKQFRIQSDSWNATKTVSDQLQQLLTPDVFVPPSEDMRKMMFSRVVTNQLRRISDRETYIHWDKSKQMVYVYGITADKRRRGVESITKFLNDMLTKYIKFSMNFKHRKAALDFSKKWNVKTKEPTIADNITWSHVVRGKSRISVEFFGTNAGKTLVHRWFEQEGFVAADGGGAGSSEPVVLCSTDCPICFCEIDSDPYFLAACEHGGCRSCFAGQFSSANNKEFTDTPIRCSLCPSNKVMALQDVRSLASNTGLETIKRCAVNKFLRENPHIAIRCPNGIKCEQILDCRTFRTIADDDIPEQERQGGTVLAFCDLCDAEYCLPCSERMFKPVKAHKNDSCEEVRNGGISNKRRYRNILLEACTLKCPHCKTAFGGFSGCCAVTCECKKHFCGLCLAPCRDNSDAHSHVAHACKLNVHSGEYFNSQDEIEEAHRLWRIQAMKDLSKSIPQDIKEEVLESIKNDLLDFKITPLDIF